MKETRSEINGPATATDAYLCVLHVKILKNVCWY